jgi:hypothetical protein
MAPGHGVARLATVAGQTAQWGEARMGQAVSDADGEARPAAAEADPLAATVSES